MKELSRLVMDYARCQGACAVGIATTETLSGGPPSADLTHVLPEARAAICFAFPLNQALNHTPRGLKWKADTTTVSCLE